jgi:hypothetical protein
MTLCVMLVLTPDNQNNRPQLRVAKRSPAVWGLSLPRQKAHLDKLQEESDPLAVHIFVSRHA